MPGACTYAGVVGRGGRAWIRGALVYGCSRASAHTFEPFACIDTSIPFGTLLVYITISMSFGTLLVCSTISKPPFSCRNPRLR